MIELKNVSKFYTNNGVVTLGLRNINLKFNAGEIVAITGDSGSGKSTLLNVITAVDTYEEGEILFEGNETSYFNQNDMDMFRKNNVSFIFQNYNIIDSYTVLENVMIPLLLSGHTREEARTEAKKIIERVGLSKRIHHRGTKLSGGEKQRCVIARALASDSKILACDEPTGNLDSETGEEIIKLIAEVATDRLVLIVTHNYAQVENIVTRRIKISDGEVIEDTLLKETEVKDEQQAMTLEEQKIKKSIYFKLALQNVFSTPKKTIFSLLVFFVISFISLLLYLMMLEQSYDTYSTTNESYQLKDAERLIVYHRDNSPLDKEIIEKVHHKEIYYNAFYEETDIYIFSRDTNGNNHSFEVSLTYHKLKHNRIAGAEASADGEYFLVIPEYYDAYYYIESIGGELGIKYGYSYANLSYNIGKIVGVGTSSEISSPYLLCYKDFDEVFFDAVASEMSIRHYVTIDQTETIDFSNNDVIYGTDGETVIKLPSSYQNKEIEFAHYINNLYPVEMEYKIQYGEDVQEPRLYIGNTVVRPTSDVIYEAVIYTDQVKVVKNHLEQAGFMVSVPSDMRVAQVGMFNLAILYMFLGLAILALLCLFFISYIVLARIYASKNKDYGVLRTLGMVKKQLGRIVILEVMTTGFLSSILALILFIILYHTTRYFGMGEYLNAGTLSLYFVSMLIFSFFIARRFNRRLFKFSVNTTMKGEVARND